MNLACADEFRSHVVCLVTSHPNHRLGKLTRTEFRVLNIKTGYIERSIEISPKINASLGETNDRAPFTTAFKHDFLLTDTLIISGGPGGGLFVWDYSSNALDKNRLLYIIPDPWELDTTNTFPRQYSDITMSADGRLVAATTSDQLLIFDIIEKKLSGVYSNGRKVEQKDRYVSNPQDDFPGGMWCLFREWEGEDMRQETVAYLTDVPDEKAMARYSRSNLAVLFRRSLTESSPTWIGSNVYVSGVLVALGGVVISILIQKLCTSSGV